ncbi:MAG: hypothetical protein HY999_00520 [Nitrospinae bacterium]|nr:hypothetical protein [Nitrospinota bacterium]
MKKVLVFLLSTFFTVTITSTSYAQLGGQVFYKYGGATLRDDRGGEVFTDTLNMTRAGKNDDNTGFAVAAGLDIPLIKLFGNTLLGEVMLEYAKFSDKEVLTTTSGLLYLDGVGKPNVEEVAVSELIVVVAPKYRFELGKVRPWIIPIGLAFMVNSPPSNDTTYLDIGYHAGVGVEYMIIDLISIGVDYRGTFAAKHTGIDATYSSYGVYVGINF